MHHGLTQRHRGIVNDVASVEVVASIDDHVVLTISSWALYFVDTERVASTLTSGFSLVDGSASRLGLVHAQGVGVVHHLALQVVRLDDVGSMIADRADAAAAMYRRAGEPSPPAPIDRTFDSSSLI